MTTLTLNEKKINHLRELIETFYDLENEVERADCASTIVGVLDYIIDTDTMHYREPTFDCGPTSTTTVTYVNEANA